MKKSIINFLTILTIITTGLFMNSCIDPSYEVLWEGAAVEFDAAVWNNPAAGRTYPILNRVPAQGRATSTTAGTPDPLITRASGTVPLRVNLISKHLPSAQTFPITVVSDGTTAQSGVHYTVPNTVTVPANESFGIIEVTILNPGPGTGSVDLVLELGGNNDIPVAENYKMVAIRIAQN